MSDQILTRLEQVERRLANVERALGVVREPVRPPVAPPATASVPPPAPARQVVPTREHPPPRPRRPAREIDWSVAFGPKGLAVAGGIVTVLGIVFFVALAVNRGGTGPGEEEDDSEHRHDSSGDGEALRAEGHAPVDLARRATRTRRRVLPRWNNLTRRRGWQDRSCCRRCDRRTHRFAHDAERALDVRETAFDLFQPREYLIAHRAYLPSPSSRGLSSTSSSQSSAAAIPSRVSMRGGRPPLSRRAIADCVVPHNSASCCWERPSAARRSATCSAIAAKNHPWSACARRRRSLSSGGRPDVERDRIFAIIAELL